MSNEHSWSSAGQGQDNRNPIVQEQDFVWWDREKRQSMRNILCVSKRRRAPRHKESNGILTSEPGVHVVGLQSQYRQSQADVLGGQFNAAGVVMLYFSL